MVDSSTHTTTISAGNSNETTHIEDISRVGCCGYGHVTTSWVNLDLILEGTVLKTCIPVVHL